MLLTGARRAPLHLGRCKTARLFALTGRRWLSMDAPLSDSVIDADDFPAHSRTSDEMEQEPLEGGLAETGEMLRLLKNGDVATILNTGRVPERRLAETVLHGRASHRPYLHPRTHNIPVATIHFRSYFPQLLDTSTHFATHAASALAIPCSRVVPLPTQRSLWTVLRGPFAHKKSQENFERKTHKRLLKAWDADQEVIDRWITYLQLHPVAGVGMRIVRWHRAPVGIGRQKVTESVHLHNVTNKKKMEDVAAQIVKEELAAASKAAVVPQVPAKRRNTTQRKQS